MATLEPFVLKVKPALDAYLRAPQKEQLARLRYELSQFSFTNMKIFHAQILAPLVLKLEELHGQNQELKADTIDCLRIVISKLYLDDVKAVRTLLVVVLMQLRDSDSISTKPHLSEELKLVAVQCMAETLRRSSSDVLELFYMQESEMLLGQVLLTLVEFLEKEKYRKLLLASLDCLMVVFYVHNEAVVTDVVLRNQVADTVFKFLPKIVVVLNRICLSDEKLGETIKATAITALGSILCIIYEETGEAVIRSNYAKQEFLQLIAKANQEAIDTSSDAAILGSKLLNEPIEERIKRLKQNVRSTHWFAASSRKLCVVFTKTSVLRSHESAKIRREYGQMCCTLIRKCGRHLKENFVYLLENVIAMSEDEDEQVRQQCTETLQLLQHEGINVSIFDECCELLFDEHLTKLPRIINRCDESEQYAELLFFKGFLRNLSAHKLHLLLSVPKNLDMLCMCLLSGVDLKMSRDLLTEEYALREMNEMDVVESMKFPWRQYKKLNSTRCREAILSICDLLGKTPYLERIVYDYLAELLTQQNQAMNEVLLLMLWVTTADGTRRSDSRSELVEMLLNEILLDKHWHLAVQPDEVWRLKVDKPTDWFADHTPGLYESAIEIRTQDCDSDDDVSDADRKNHVTMIDAEFNVLHTCLILDALGHCALFYGEYFDRFLFRCLHKTLLKVASSNTMIYHAAIFCLSSIQRSLHFAKLSHLIETHSDYISYHMNMILKRSPESRSAVDILSVVLQFSTRNSLAHMESIFDTIREECSKSHQFQNVNAYLRVFSAFVAYLSRWQQECNNYVVNIPMHVDSNEADETDVFVNWVTVLVGPVTIGQQQHRAVESEQFQGSKVAADQRAPADTVNCDADATVAKPELPRHIKMLKNIMDQVLKLVSSADKSHKILSLECLIIGLPLMVDYEDELLPLVHLVWQPLVEQFRQKDAIVLNRCFTLLNILATCAKEFILKRSLDDVIPFLVDFFRKAAAHSATEIGVAQTQEYKLQLKLLQDFPNLIRSIQIDGKHLYDIADVASLYLSQQQPKEMQNYAVQFFERLLSYNGPVAYLVVVKKSHLEVYKTNTAKVLAIFGVTASQTMA